MVDLKLHFGVKFVESSNMAKVTTSRTTFSRFHNFQIKELSIGELDAVAKLSSFQLFHENAFRLLESLKRDEIKIDIVSTGRHPQIRKLMRVDPSFNGIKHQFDPWHVAKGICKSLNKASVKKKQGQAVAMDTVDRQPSLVER